MMMRPALPYRAAARTSPLAGLLGLSRARGSATSATRLPSLAVRSSSSMVVVVAPTPASRPSIRSTQGRRGFADAAAPQAGGTMAQIKELRARTGAGVMDCKEALAASAGDPAKAELWLLDKARSRFAKKADRPTTEGALALALSNPSSSSSPPSALLVEVNSETDFVGRLEGFQKLALDAAAAALSRAVPAAGDNEGPYHLDSEWLSSLPLGEEADVKTVGDGVVGLFMQVGENMKVRRGVLLRAPGPNGAVGAFIQGTGLPHTGTLAALVALQAQPSTPNGAPVGGQLLPLANSLAKHIAGINPKYLSLQDAPEAEGKEHVVLEQEMTHDEQTARVRELLEREGAKLGARVSVTHFIRWKVGDGLEKPATDFAAEVEKELQRSTTTH